MIALSIVLSIVESIISVSFITIPGMKLGLANIAILVVLYTLDKKSAITVGYLRITLVGLIYSGLFTPTFWFSLSGGTLAMIVMVLLKDSKLSIYTVSVLSALMHMIGQILAAIVVVNTATLLYYLPYMIIISVPAGLITGYLANHIIVTFSRRIIRLK